jgi:hypothetical protein
MQRCLADGDAHRCWSSSVTTAPLRSGCLLLALGMTTSELVERRPRGSGFRIAARGGRSDALAHVLRPRPDSRAGTPAAPAPRRRPARGAGARQRFGRADRGRSVCRLRERRHDVRRARRAWHVRERPVRPGHRRDGWRTQVLGWAESVRLEIASQDHDPIFVGVAPPGEIARRLSGTGYTTFAEHTGRGVARIDHEGSAPAVAPVSRVHWTAHAQGVGTQTVRWKATDGPQAVFATHADGSRPIRVRVVSSAVTLDRMPWWALAGTLILGLVLLPTGVVVLRRAIRVRRST